MANSSHGIGGLAYDPKKRTRPSELNVLVALILIVVVFEVLGRLILGDSFLFNTREKLLVYGGILFFLIICSRQGKCG
jgi:inositol transport system permease protein